MKKDELKGKIGISYIRFSSKRQALGTSYKRQLKSTKEFCERYGMVLDDREFYDAGVSGFRGKNSNSDLGVRAPV